MATALCNSCGSEADALAWRCRACAGSLDLIDLPPFDEAAINRERVLALALRWLCCLPRGRFSLGEGLTPLAPAQIDGMPFHAKLEYLNPTGSFKDRGTAVMLNHLAVTGAADLIDNSSGNAGASLAAYAGVAGLSATVYVPAATAVASKKRLIRAFGGAIVESHDYLADVYAAAETATYASHAWNPYFVLGQQTAAWETWEQLGKRAPDAVAAPVGHGGLFLGFYRGFRALHDVGLIDKLPRMIAVQSAGVDPIVRAWEARAQRSPTVTPAHSVADGILVDQPVRGEQILEALYTTDGFALRVDNDAILRAQRAMHAAGFMIETTSAVTSAALPQIRVRIGEPAALVLAFTGSGLKAISDTH